MFSHRYRLKERALSLLALGLFPNMNFPNDFLEVLSFYFNLFSLKTVSPNLPICSADRLKKGKKRRRRKWLLSKIKSIYLFLTYTRRAAQLVWAQNSPKINSACAWGLFSQIPYNKIRLQYYFAKAFLYPSNVNAKILYKLFGWECDPPKNVVSPQNVQAMQFSQKVSRPFVNAWAVRSARSA